ncbi:MAG: type III-B CRISPR-associated protein Cas10/Cmr2 [bacterium]
MKNEDFWKIKLSALLHDPPHKTFIRLEEKNHEKEASQLYKKLVGEKPVNGGKVKPADHIASAMSRLLVEQTRWKPNPSYKDALFIDPFTLKQQELSPVDTQKIEQFFQACSFFHSLGDEPKYKPAFLYCWRFMPEYFSDWLLNHPADDRACNHCVYDHAVQTSAIASALPQPSLLFFTIANVQEFISTSRKTQDLWSASYLLSYLMWEAMLPIIEEFGPDSIIYPCLLANPFMDKWLYDYFQKLNPQNPLLKELLTTLEQNLKPEKRLTPSLPNVFLAILPYEKAKEKAGESKRKAEEAFDEIAQIVFEKIGEKVPGINYSKMEFPFHLFWVVLPLSTKGISGDEDGEKEAEIFIEEYKKLVGETNLVKMIESVKDSSVKSRRKFFNLGTAYSLFYAIGRGFLRSRKLIRNFSQSEEKGRYRCSLCGAHSELSGKETASEADKFWGEVRWKFPSLLREGERLCKLCLIKRFAPSLYFKEEEYDPSAFPSTFEVATAVYKDNLEDKDKKDFLQSFEILKSDLEEASCHLPKTNPVPKLSNDVLAHIDGQWLMEDSYKADYIAREYGGDKEKIEEILGRNEIISLLGKIRRKYGEPPRYYSILFLDGDEIHKWIGGEKLPPIRELLHPTYLCKFATQLPPVLDERHPVSPSLHQMLSRKMGEFALHDVRRIVEENFGALVYAGGDDALAFLPIENLLPSLFQLQREWRKRLGKVTISAGAVIAHCKMPLQRALEVGRMALKKAKEKYKRDAFCIITLPRGGEMLEGGSKWYVPSNSELPVPCLLYEIAMGFRLGKLSGRFPYQFAQVQREMGENKEVLERELARIYERKEFRDPSLLERMKALLKNEDISAEGFANLLLISHFIGTRGCIKRDDASSH